jgi:hypothetical protein
MNYKKGDIVVVKFPFILKELISRKIGGLQENLITEVEHRLKRLFGINAA